MVHIKLKHVKTEFNLFFTVILLHVHVCDISPPPTPPSHTLDLRQEARKEEEGKDEGDTGGGGGLMRRSKGTSADKHQLSGLVVSEGWDQTPKPAASLLGSQQDRAGLSGA